MEKLLLGKSILVFGAGGLLGVSLVASLLQQSAKVIAVDINSDTLKTQLVDAGVQFEKGNIVLESLDISNEENVKDFFQNIEPIDGAVNTSYPKNKEYGKHFFDVTLDSFNENVSLHLGSSFLFMQQCSKYFIKHKKPFSLVNISSIYGVIAPKFEIYKDTSMTTPVEYVAIKSALINLSKYVIKYVCDSKFRINVVSPGGVLDKQPEIFIKAYKRNSLGKGMLEAKDVIKPILFLLSSQSEYLNGQNIIVDDGFSI